MGKEKEDKDILEHMKLFQLILDNMAEGVALADENGKLILLNPPGERILGKELLETDPKQFTEKYGLFLPDMETPFPTDELPLLRAVRGEEVDRCEIFVRHSDKPEGIFIRINARPIKDHNGKLQGAVAVFTDITESKKALHSLEISEERYRNLIDASFEGIIIYDKGEIIYANNTAVQFFGYSVEEFTHMTILDLVVAEDRENIGEKLALVSNNPDVELGAVETICVRKDGSKFPIEAYGKGIYFDGRIVRVIAIRDITGRRKADRELQYRMDFENLITSLSTSFINLEPDEIDEGIDSGLQKIGEFAGVDRCFIALLSEDKKSMEAIYEWCTGDCRPIGAKHQHINESVLPWLFKTIKEREPKYVQNVKDLPPETQKELKAIMPDGLVSAVVVPMIHEKTIKGIFGLQTTKREKKWNEDIIVLLKIVGEIFVNALERKRALEALQKANEDLELKVEERTKELKEKHIQLLNADKMASLGQLVAGVAHEINTPLGALKSNNDVFIRSIKKVKNVISDLENDGHQHEYSTLQKLFTVIDQLNEVSKTAAERIIVIVNSLRNFARLDRAEKDLFNIEEGLESTLTLVHHEFKNRVTVQKEYGDIPKISCYPNQLNQVFMNILVNAAQAIEGKGDIVIRTYTENGFVIIEFEDSGRGIDKEDIKKIFSPGFTTKGVGVGTGLGLSIVYQIIKDHRGEIDIGSEVGKGTMVKISLPIDSNPN